MSLRKIRRPEGLGEPLGRYSHLAVGRGELVFVAGQAGVAADGSVVPGGVAGQTRQVFANLAVALGAAGLGFGDVAKMTTYLVGEDSIEPFMAVRTEVFGAIFPDGDYPPNTLLVVSRLVEAGLLVEIEAIALG